MIAMNTELELEHAIKEILTNQNILKLYHNKESYFWSNRYEITKAVSTLKDKDLYLSSELLTQFEQFIKPLLGNEIKQSTPNKKKSPAQSILEQKRKISKQNEKSADSSGEHTARTNQSELIVN